MGVDAKGGRQAVINPGDDPPKMLVESLLLAIAHQGAFRETTRCDFSYSSFLTW